jgi:hypothetical protein
MITATLKSGTRKEPAHRYFVCVTCPHLLDFQMMGTAKRKTSSKRRSVTSNAAWITLAI